MSFAGEFAPGGLYAGLCHAFLVFLMTLNDFKFIHLFAFSHAILQTYAAVDQISIDVARRVVPGTGKSWAKLISIRNTVTFRKQSH